MLSRFDAICSNSTYSICCGFVVQLVVQQTNPQQVEMSTTNRKLYNIYIPQRDGRADGENEHRGLASACWIESVSKPTQIDYIFGRNCIWNKKFREHRPTHPRTKYECGGGGISTVSYNVPGLSIVILIMVYYYHVKNVSIVIYLWS